MDCVSFLRDDRSSYINRSATDGAAIERMRTFHLLGAAAENNDVIWSRSLKAFVREALAIMSGNGVSKAQNDRRMIPLLWTTEVIMA